MLSALTEPEPENYGFLLRNIEFNSYKNVFSLQEAIFNMTGKVNLMSSIVGHSLYHPVYGKAAITVDEVKVVPVNN